MKDNKNFAELSIGLQLEIKKFLCLHNNAFVYFYDDSYHILSRNLEDYEYIGCYDFIDVLSEKEFSLEFANVMHRYSSRYNGKKDDTIIEKEDAIYDYDKDGNIIIANIITEE